MKLDPRNRDSDELKRLETAALSFLVSVPGGVSLHTGTTIKELGGEKLRDLTEVVECAIAGVVSSSHLDPELPNAYVTGVGFVPEAAVHAAHRFAMQILDGGTPLDYEVEKARLVVRHFTAIYEGVHQGRLPLNRFG